MDLSTSLITSLNYTDASFQEGCMFIRRYEEHRNVALVDWGRTDEALFEAMTAPSRDGWQGIVLVNGSTIDYDGSRWRQGTPV